MDPKPLLAVTQLLRRARQELFNVQRQPDAPQGLPEFLDPAGNEIMLLVRSLEDAACFLGKDPE